MNVFAPVFSVWVDWLFFMGVVALKYRDFSTMKAVYIYPAILSFVILFLEALRMLDDLILQRSIWLRILFLVSIVFLIGLYITDVFQMTVHLYDLNLR